MLIVTMMMKPIKNQIGATLVELVLVLGVLVLVVGLGLAYAFKAMNEKEGWAIKEIALNSFLTGGETTIQMGGDGDLIPLGDAGPNNDLGTALMSNSQSADETIQGDGTFASALLEAVVSDGGCSESGVNIQTVLASDAYGDSKTVPQPVIDRAKKLFLSSGCDRRLRYFDSLFVIDPDSVEGASEIESYAVKHSKQSRFTVITTVEQAPTPTPDGGGPGGGSGGGSGSSQSQNSSLSGLPGPH